MHSTADGQASMQFLHHCYPCYPLECIRVGGISKQTKSIFFYTSLEGICESIYWSMEDVQISNLHVAEKYLFQMYFLLILSILQAIFIPETNGIGCQQVTYPLYFVLIHVASQNVVEYKNRQRHPQVQLILVGFMDAILFHNFIVIMMCYLSF